MTTPLKHTIKAICLAKCASCLGLWTTAYNDCLHTKCHFVV